MRWMSVLILAGWILTVADTGGNATRGLQAAEPTLDELKSVVNLQDQLLTAKDEIKKAETERDTKIGELAQVRKDLNAANDQNASLQKKQADLEAKLKDCDTKLGKAQKDADDAIKAQQTAEANLAKTRAANAKQKKELATAKAELEDTKKKLKDAECLLEKIRNAVKVPGKNCESSNVDCDQKGATLQESAKPGMNSIVFLGRAGFHCSSSSDVPALFDGRARVVIREGMTLEFDSEGKYKVQLIADAPKTQVTLRLQLMVPYELPAGLPPVPGSLVFSSEDPPSRSSLVRKMTDTEKYAAVVTLPPIFLPAVEGNDVSGNLPVHTVTKSVEGRSPALAFAYRAEQKVPQFVGYSLDRRHQNAPCHLASRSGSAIVGSIID